MKIIMHIDINNAYLSWSAIKLLEQGSKYDIRNSYAVIGGDPKKRSGVVLAKSTPAKKMGVLSGETLYQAKKKCPALRIYPPDYQYYQIMHNKFIQIIKKYTPDIEVMSIDECAIDYTPVLKMYGEPFLFAQKLQEEIYQKLGFTVNIGIANNKLCAKMASDFSKPNKIHTLYQVEIETKMWPLPIDNLIGVGKSSVVKMNDLGIYKIGDLAHYDLNKLTKVFKNMAKNYIMAAQGIDNSKVIIEKIEYKGIGNEITLLHDIKNTKELEKHLFSLVDMVSRRLRKEEKYASVIAVYLKNNKFKKYSHQISLKNATNDTDEIFKIAKKLLYEMHEDDWIRLIGLRFANLKSNYNHQISLFDSKEEANKLDKTIDDLKNKYGSKIINKASLHK